jgi:hypothetical protein
MKILTEIIQTIRDEALAAGCDGVVINAQIQLTVCNAPVIIEIPITVALTPNVES